jgi:S-adenosylmethionine:tRNA ribosyltransferase-isomerase
VHNSLLSDLIFDLPEKLLAKFPIVPADHCRLLCINKKSGILSEKMFYELPQLLQCGDLLVFNNTRVEARRVFLKRENHAGLGTGRFECLFLEKIENNERLWKVLIKKSKRLKNDEILVSEIDSNITFRLIKSPEGTTIIQEHTGLDTGLNEEVFSRIGQMPIPPYLNREQVPADKENYQNPFGVYPGSVAAPTAALHFTLSLLNELKEKNIDIDYVTLHVGYGTFAPLNNENFHNNKLHEEFYSIPKEFAEKLARKKYKRIISVGTTTLRVLETVYRKTNGLYNDHLFGKTNIFLYPPEKIKSVDGLITNFHLPGSSLLMLVACMMNQNELMSAYRHAIEQEYRFYSYGDGMFII